MWSLIGLLLAGALAAIAWWRSSAPAGHYDGEVYGMTPAVHRRYGATGIVLAIYFAATAAIHALPVIPFLAITVVIVILYGASFLRGAESDE